ncbi:UNVERIFIED_CONTAM: PadR family transcriptional regulator [Microbacterium sp. SLM126]
MQFVILGLLMIAPMSLYDLHKQFAAGPSLFYSASFGSLQRALRQLVAQGWVTVTDASSSGRRRNLHTPTDEGVEAWRAWMREPLAGAHAETSMLAKVFLLGLLPRGGERDAALGELRRSAAAGLAELRAVADGLDAAQIADEFAEIFAYQRATLDYGLRSHELALSWLDGLD